MTTSNRIITNSQEESLFVPIESLFNQDDSITYVFVKRGMSTTKQEVIIGASNRNEVIITSGLTESDKVYLNRIAGMENDEVELLPELEGKRNLKEEEPAEAPEMKEDGRPGMGKGKRGKRKKA